MPSAGRLRQPVNQHGGVGARPRALSISVTNAGRRRDPPSGYAQAIPGTMVMFTMLVLLTSGTVTLVIERGQGLPRRLAATPIPRGTVTARKWFGKLAVARTGFRPPPP